MRGQCAICETTFSPNLTGISAVACGHTFHDACLFTWSTKNTKCPNCTVNLRAQSAITKLIFRVDLNSIMEQNQLMRKDKIAALERSVNLAYRTINHQAAILDKVNIYFDTREAYEKAMGIRLNMAMCHFEELADEEKRTVEAIDDRLKQGEEWHMTLQEDICAHVDRLRNNAASITEEVMRQRKALLEEVGNPKRAITVQTDLMRGSKKRLHSEDAQAKKRAVLQMGTESTRASSSNLVEMAQDDLTEQQRKSVQEELPALVDQLRGDIAKVETMAKEQGDMLLENLGNYERTILAQSALIEGLKNFICGEDEQFATNHETPGPSNPEIHPVATSTSELVAGDVPQTVRCLNNRLGVSQEEEQLHRSVQDYFSAQIEGLWNDLAKVEKVAMKHSDDLLAKMTSAKQTMVAQSVLLGSLKKRICGKDAHATKRKAVAHRMTRKGMNRNTRTWHLEYANRALVKLLQKYTTEIFKKEELLPIQLNHISTQLKAVLDAEECNMDKNPISGETSAINADHSKLLKMERLEQYDNQEKDVIILDKNALSGEVDHSKRLKMKRLEKDDNQEKDIIILDENPTSSKDCAMNTGQSKLSKIKLKLLERCVSRETDAIMMDKNPTSEEERAMDTGQSNLLTMESLEKNNNREKRKMDNKNRTPSEASVMDAGHSKLSKMESLEKNNIREKTVLDKNPTSVEDSAIDAGHSELLKMKSLKKCDSRKAEVILIDKNSSSGKASTTNTSNSKLVKMKSWKRCSSPKKDVILMDNNPQSNKARAMEAGHSKLLKTECLERKSSRKRDVILMDNNPQSDKASTMEVGHSKLLKKKCLERKSSRKRDVILMDNNPQSDKASAMEAGHSKLLKTECLETYTSRKTDITTLDKNLPSDKASSTDVSHSKRVKMELLESYDSKKKDIIMLDKIKNPSLQGEGCTIATGQSKIFKMNHLKSHDGRDKKVIIID